MLRLLQTLPPSHGEKIVNPVIKIKVPVLPQPAHCLSGAAEILVGRDGKVKGLEFRFKTRKRIKRLVQVNVVLFQAATLSREGAGQFSHLLCLILYHVTPQVSISTQTHGLFSVSVIR